MSKDFSLSIHLLSETKEHLDHAAQRIGVPREVVVEFAVEELLEDLGYDTLPEDLSESALSQSEI